MHATSGVPFNLCHRQVDVPERDDDLRDQAATGVATPLFDHPVVVGLHAGEAQVLVLAFVEGLSTEPREGGEAHRGFDVADVHVFEPSLLVVAARTHVVVGDRRHGHLFDRVPGRSHHALVGVDEVSVDPAVDLVW